MKIGILTYHRSINYGAFLQAYCLSKYVQKVVGDRATVEIIDYTSKSSSEGYNSLLFKRNDKKNAWKKRIGFERSYFLLPMSRKTLFSDDLAEIKDFLAEQKYDLIIVGSDEVWKVDGMRGFPTAYWLNFDLGDCEKISYAVSARTDYHKIDAGKRNYMKESICQFRYLGARDRMTVNLVQQISGREPYLNCDPTFLIPFHYDQSVYKKKFKKRYRLEENQRLLGIMIPDQKLITKIHREMGNEYKVIALYDSHKDADIDMVGIGPFEWLKVIGCLDFLITDRFHGTVFAMKMKIPFLSVETYDTEENSKLYDMLGRNGLENHYMIYHAGNTVYEEILSKIRLLSQHYDKEKIQKALENENKRSSSFRKELLTILNEHERKGNQYEKSDH